MPVDEREATSVTNIQAQLPEGSAHPHHGPPWWQGAVGYQVYLRSFLDASGDGVGDLAGLRAGLPHIARLGVDAIWISPFYDSPQVDHGYDVSDHRDVHREFGTLAEFEQVVDEAHRLGLRVIVDVIPNHTSDRHPWFLDACSSRGAVHRDFYIWRDPAPDGGPPNNWVSKFGGPAWTFHPATGQYYLHTFLPEQPDLDWRNPRVRAEFEDLLRFWLDRGVDGFRVDAAQHLLKAHGLPDNPQIRNVGSDDDPEAVFAAFDHVHDADQDEVVEIFRGWRRLADEHGAVLVGEVVLPDVRRVHRYTQDALHLAFHFPALKTGWDADAIRAAVDEAVTLAPGGRFAWPLSSHDDPRAAHRFGGGAAGARRTLAYLTLLAGLPGMTFLLQGDELGLDHGKLEPSGSRDPLAVRNAGTPGRDGSRTPMPWEPGHAFGFTTATPWIDFPSDRTSAHTVAAQQADPQAPLATTTRLLQARRSLPSLHGDAPIRWLDAPREVLAYQRGDTIVACNTDAEERSLFLPAPAAVHVATDPGAIVDGPRLILPGDAAAILRLDHQPSVHP